MNTYNKILDREQKRIRTSKTYITNFSTEIS